MQRSCHGAFLGSSLRAAVVATMAMPATAARENADVAVKTECAAWVVSVIVIADGVATRKDGGALSLWRALSTTTMRAKTRGATRFSFPWQVQAPVRRDAALSSLDRRDQPKLQIYFWVGCTKLLVVISTMGRDFKPFHFIDLG